MSPGIVYSIGGVGIKAVRKDDHTYGVWRYDYYIGTTHRIKTRHYEVHGVKFDKLYTAVAYIVREWTKEKDNG